MACNKPIKAYISRHKKTPSGKALISFTGKDSGISDIIDLPCGQCMGCRIDRSRTWAIRCMHEASLYEQNSFLTLTYSDDYINDKMSLVKDDFRLFMKRMRKHHKGVTPISYKGKVRYPIRYFQCGEYGDEFQRPHHHVCLFNFDFDDKILFKVENENNIYVSETLCKRWPNGFATIQDLNIRTAAYCARYCIKKVTGDEAAEHYVRVDEETGEMFYIEPEYISMSLRPGIGRLWFERYHSDVYPKDFITDSGKIFSTPRYYDKLYDISNHESLEQIKRRRKKYHEQKPEESTKRLHQKDKAMKRALEAQKRNLK